MGYNQMKQKSKGVAITRGLLWMGRLASTAMCDACRGRSVLLGCMASQWARCGSCLLGTRLIFFLSDLSRYVDEVVLSWMPIDPS